MERYGRGLYPAVDRSRLRERVARKVKCAVKINAVSVIHRKIMQIYTDILDIVIIVNNLSSAVK